MKLSIHYKALYRYEADVSLSPHIARIFPRADLLLKVNSSNFSSASSADVQLRRDLFDNVVAHCFFPKHIQDLPFALDLEIEVEERDPFRFLLDARALNIPCQYTEDEQAILSAFLKCGSDIALPAPLAPAAARPTIETLVGMNQWIHGNLAYERRDEGDPFVPQVTLERGSGSCRDFAALLAEALRQNGIAARLASGFVWEGDRAEEDKRSESAMHAWVEAYLPGAGWLGMDPTNGSLSDHHFITTAVGLRHADVSPVGGTYFGNQVVKSHLETSLEVRRA